MNKVHEAIKMIKEFNVTELVQFFNELKETFGVTEDMLQVGAAPVVEDDSQTTVVDPNKKVSIVISEIGQETKLAFIKTMKELFALSMSEAGAKFIEISNGNITILKSDLTRKESEEIMVKLKVQLATAAFDIK